MRSKSTQRLGAVLDTLINEQGYRPKFDEAKALDAWKQLAGKSIGAVTTNVYVHSSRLYVELNSSAWRQELHMERQAWCEQLNSKLGKPVIKEIIFR